MKAASGKQSAKTKADPGLQTKQNLKANRIINEGPFDHRSYGFKNLIDLFEAIDLFEVRRTKGASNTTISVRIAKVGGNKVKPKVIEPDWDSEVEPDDIPF